MRRARSRAQAEQIACSIGHWLTFASSPLKVTFLSLILSLLPGSDFKHQQTTENYQNLKMGGKLRQSDIRYPTEPVIGD